MKHLKIFENDLNSIETDLLKILDNELYLDHYYNYVSTDGKQCAVREIVNYLTKLGIDLSLYSNSKKYNL